MLAGFQLPYMFPYITVYYHCQEKYTLFQESVQDPGNIFAPGGQPQSGAKYDYGSMTVLLALLERMQGEVGLATRLLYK